MENLPGNSHVEQEPSKSKLDNRNYKHYLTMLATALDRKDPIVLEWIKDAWVRTE